MMHFSAFLILFLPLAPLGAGKEDVVERLKKKGVRFVLDRATGVPTETGFGTQTGLTLEDYRALGSLRSLRKLRLSATDLPLDDRTAPLLAGLDGLEYFFANGARMSDDGMRAFAGLKNLKHFGFDHWFGPEGARSKKFVGAGLKHLAALPRLESVRFGGCRIDDAACAALAEVKTLRKIDLFHAFAVTDEGIAAMCALPDLRWIKLGPQFTPRITDRTLVHLASIPTLEEIHLTETWLTYANGFVHLKKLPNLKVIDLPRVLAEKEDVERFRKDHPRAKVQWTLPEEKEIVLLRKRFAREKN